MGPSWLELLHLMAERDEVTAEHCNRVARYCLKLAPVSGLTMAERHMLYVAARLHHIATLGLPPDMLLAALADIEAEISIIIRHHDERWGGAADPDELRAHHIPRLARILTAADLFDVITRKRPDWSALSFDAAMDELRAVSGMQLDPEVVAALASLWTDVVREVSLAACSGT